MIQVDIRNRFNDEIIFTAEIDSRFKDEPRSIWLRAAVLKALEEGRRRDFSEADLHGADFSNIDFSVFEEVDFSHSDLSEANIAETNFTKSVLQSTNFNLAKITGKTKGIIHLGYPDGELAIGWCYRDCELYVISNETNICFHDLSQRSFNLEVPDRPELTRALIYCESIAAIRLGAGENLRDFFAHTTPDPGS